MNEMWTSPMKRCLLTAKAVEDGLRTGNARVNGEIFEHGGCFEGGRGGGPRGGEEPEEPEEPEAPEEPKTAGRTTRRSTRNHQNQDSPERKAQDGERRWNPFRTKHPLDSACVKR